MRPSFRPLAAVVVVAALLAGCQTGDERAEAPAPSNDVGGGPAAPQPAPRPQPSPLADLVVELESATYDEGDHRAGRRAPVALRIDGLGIVAAPVVAVGVDVAGELAVPGPADVGWYRFGPAPGEPGSAVLAAHVAFDGVDGVFRHLTDLEPGADVVVRMDDGTELRYRVAELTTVPKEALPAEVWAKDGPPRLALVTCGGSFDRSRRSYDGNVIAWAEPA